MRFLVAMVLVAVVADVATADLPPRPPKPTDSQTVRGSCSVSLGSEVQGWVFVTSQVGVIPGRKGPPPIVYSRVELSEKKPADLTGMTLHAIPAEAAKAYPKEADLTEAVRKDKLEGVQKYNFPIPKVEVRKGEKAVPPKSVFLITGIDEKGIHVSEAKSNNAPSEKKPLALAEPGTLVGGIAAALAVTFGGLWLVRRKKAMM